MLHNLLLLVISLLLGCIIGFERYLHGKIVGIRTISLITIGSTLFVLMSPHILDGDNSRVVAQIVSGVGFLGAGIIFKNGNTVSGLTTAATIWAAAAVGALVGMDMIFEACAGTVLIFIVNMLFGYAKHRIERKDENINEDENENQ